MSSSEKIVAFLIAAVAACTLAVLIVSVTVYYMDMNSKMESAIKAGNSPMDVYCAFNGSSESKVCLVRSATKGESK